MKTNPIEFNVGGCRFKAKLQRLDSNTFQCVFEGERAIHIPERTAVDVIPEKALHDQVIRHVRILSKDNHDVIYWEEITEFDS